MFLTEYSWLRHLVNRQSGVGSCVAPRRQRVQLPPRNRFGPPGCNRNGGGVNEAVGVFVERSRGDSATIEAITSAKAEQVPKQQLQLPPALWAGTDAPRCRALHAIAAWTPLANSLFV